MTRLVHTADVHLTPDAPERLAALSTVLDVAEEQDAAAVTIGGDCFDDPADVESLRAELRNDLFADRDLEVLLIPGNHDEAAFRGDVFFGECCTVLAGDPFEHWVAPAGDLRVTGLPYRERPDDDLLLALQEREPFDGTEVLLLHCSLDAPFEDETGEGEVRRYFPVNEGLLTRLDFDCYLAGHYHGPRQVAFRDGSTFVYPGTPASTSTAETGRRQVGVLDADGLSLAGIDSYHRIAETFTVTPGEVDAVLASIRGWVDRHVDVDAEADIVVEADADIVVEGFHERDERAFHEELTTAAAPVEPVDRTRSVGHLLAHPLYEAFATRLADRDWDEETTAAVRERTLAVFAELDARGEL